MIEATIAFLFPWLLPFAAVGLGMKLAMLVLSIIVGLYLAITFGVLGALDT